jgi:hypothetical protein
MWCRVIFSGLLLGGCSFDAMSANGGTADAANDDKGVVDAGLRFDATPGVPDTGPGDPDAGSHYVDFTLTIPCDGSWVTSPVSLEPGATYHLIASGVCMVDPTAGTYRSDAEYFWKSSKPFDAFDMTGGVDVGIAVNDTVLDDTRTPRWGEYDETSHDYLLSEFVGQGAPVTVLFWDSSYSNNSGSLSVEIQGPQPEE